MERLMILRISQKLSNFPKYDKTNVSRIYCLVHNPPILEVLPLM